MSSCSYRVFGTERAGTPLTDCDCDYDFDCDCDGCYGDCCTAPCTAHLAVGSSRWRQGKKRRGHVSRTPVSRI